MNKHRFSTAIETPRASSVRSFIFFAISVCFTATGLYAENAWRTAAGATISQRSSTAPLVSTSFDDESTISAVYKFAKPQCFVDAKGVTDIVLSGVENAGQPGAPALPVMPVRIAIPQGREIQSVSFVPNTPFVVAKNALVRHVSKSTTADCKSAVETPRDDTIYKSNSPYPAQPHGDWKIAHKRGVAFCETDISPVSYIPAAGEVRVFTEITVKITLAPVANKKLLSAPKAGANVVPFLGATPSLANFFDNPTVVLGYAKKAAAPSKKLFAGVNADLLPCSSDKSYRHVIITSTDLENAFADNLAKYRTENGISSVVITVEDIVAKYSGYDTQAKIREFIKDAYAKWGTEYVVLGGDATRVPSRSLLARLDIAAENFGEEDISEYRLVPSDLYYQCLDGDFDANGNGTYGESDDEVDLYAEVYIGRVPATSAAEVIAWCNKVKKYDECCTQEQPYAKSALFAAENLREGYTSDNYGKKLMEQIRIGLNYTLSSGGFKTLGFLDAPEMFDAERMGALYDRDRDPRYPAVDGIEQDGSQWTSEELISLINSSDYSVINHVGHSDYLMNMRIAASDIDDQLYNELPVFVYSQGCRAGGFDEDCFAAKMLGSQYGAFAGVWNAREGIFAYDNTGILTSGASQRFQRCFWDAVFTGSRAIGEANALSHEANARYVSSKNYSWVLYETNLFGDPAQCIGGPESKLEFDSTAYTPSAEATVVYETASNQGDSVIGSLYAISEDQSATNKIGSVQLSCQEASAIRVIYSGTINLSDYAPVLADGMSILFSLDATPGLYDVAVIDEFAPVVYNIVLSNPTEDSISIKWNTDEVAFCDVYVGTSLPLTEMVAVTGPDTAHSALVEGLDYGYYYVRIDAYDYAGNRVTNPANIASRNPAEYFGIAVSPREVRASFDMESDTSSWTVMPAAINGRDNCWQLGVPTYGPENATRLWGTVVNGRYPDGASDSLISPAVTLRSNPSIIFRQWYDIEATPRRYANDVLADYGAVEVCATSPDGACVPGTLIDGTWHNISDFDSNLPATVQGKSEGWEEIRVNLPADFNGMSVRIRFRFVSDTFTARVGNPAGWYIDGVKFVDVPDDGVVLMVSEIDDGNNGIAAPGETVRVKLSTFNGTRTSFSGVDGSVTVSAAGVSADKVAINGTSPATVSYGTIASGAIVESSDYIEIAIDESVPNGTVVVLTQTLRAQNGKDYVATAAFRVEEVCAVTGAVLQPTGNPVINAQVSVNGSDRDFFATTDENGAFEINGLSSNSVLRIVAEYGFVGVDEVVTAPADDVTLELPLSEINVSQTNFFDRVLATDEKVHHSFSISNIFALASLDGNIGPSTNLEYEIVMYVDGEPADEENILWFEAASPLAGIVAPNDADEFNFVLNPQADINSRSKQTVVLRIFSNAWNVDYVDVEISFAITAVITLEPDEVTSDDISYVGDRIDFERIIKAYPDLLPGYPDCNDFDGFLEPDEYGFVYLSILNPDKYETINRFVATIEVIDGDAEIITVPGDVEFSEEQECSDQITWRDVAPGATSVSDDHLLLKWGMDEQITLRATGTAYFADGAASTEQSIDFVIENSTYNSMTGLFYSVYAPTEEINITNNVVGARVTATDAEGNVITSTPVNGNGLYDLHGLVPGALYWISYILPDGDADTILPPSVLITAEDPNIDEPAANGVKLGLSVECISSGTAWDCVRLGEVTVRDANGNGHIDVGEELSLDISLQQLPPIVNPNRGPYTYTITTPEFERGGDGEFMQIISAGRGIEDPNLMLTNIIVQVSDSALKDDIQRFMVTVFDSESDMTWSFDFALAVNPVCAIRGYVINEDGGPVDGIRVKLIDEHGGLVDTFVIDSDETEAEYVFEGIPYADPEIEYTVIVENIPTGYCCYEQAQSAYVGTMDWIAESPFIIEKSGLEVTDPSDPDGINLRIREGESTSTSVTIANNTEDASEIEVRISYSRKPAELLPASAVPETTPERVRVAPLGNDWTKLDPERFSRSEIEVLFAEGTPVAARDAYLARHGFKARYHFTTIPASIAVPNTSSSSCASLATASLTNAKSFTLSADDDDIVVAVQPTVIYKGVNAFKAKPNDQLYPEQWALYNSGATGGTLGVDIGAEEAWNYAKSFGSSDIIVAVTDTGIQYNHPDLVDNMWPSLGECFFPGYEGDVYDEPDAEGTTHGTHCAGIIGAVGNNVEGVCGVNREVSLMACRIAVPNPMTGAFMFASSGDIARAFEYAYTHGAKVNSNSWGGPEYSSVLGAAIKKAQDYNMLFVMAAGNDAVDLDITPDYPALFADYYDNVIVVASCDADGNMSSFSNFGAKHVHLAAPGSNILSTYDKGSYEYLDGTSMATPYVSGAAAFLWSLAPDAPYGVIRDAILNGVHVDANLAPFVKTSGRLDLYRSVQLLGRQWLRFDDEETVIVTNLTLAAGESVTLDLLVNDKPTLSAGSYKASIDVSDIYGSVSVPVNLTVVKAPVAEISSVEVVDGEMINGLGVAGEDGTLSIVIHNAGSIQIRNLTATLSGDGTVTTDTVTYGNISDHRNSNPGLFEVTFPEDVDDATYTLSLFTNGVAFAELPVTVQLYNGIGFSVIVTDNGAPVAGAHVEAYGPAAATAVTDEDGVANLYGLEVSDDPYTIRVIAADAVRYTDDDVTIADDGESLEVALTHADVSASESVIELTLTEGMSLATNLTISTTSGAQGKILVAPQAKIAIFDDGNSSEFLASQLKEMGFAVDLYPNNYQVVQLRNAANGRCEISYQVRHSWDDALIFGYDAVIAVVTGAKGEGRLLVESEYDAYTDYVNRGGKLIVTGHTPLAQPDNTELAEFLGFTVDACDLAEVTAAGALVEVGGIAEPFAEVEGESIIPSDIGQYDAAPSVVNDVEIDGTPIVSVADGEIVKMFISDPTPYGGQVFYWNGNYTDFTHEGVALDVLRSYLFNECIDDNVVNWLAVDATDFELDANGQLNLALSVNSDLALADGSYAASIVFLADVDGRETTPVTVKLTVEPPTVRAHNLTGHVTDWGGRNLSGNGSPSSAMIQVIYAGADGVIDPPAEDGSATGDDIVLVASGTGGLPYTRIGTGADVMADIGQFDANFNLNFDSYTKGDAGIMLYARAWDGASPVSSVAYGDSELREVTYADGLPDAIDFGSWVVGECVTDMRDSNGDSIPDAWGLKFRPDLDPRAPQTALPTEITMTMEDYFDTAADYEYGNPARVFVTDKYIFVLERAFHRVTVRNRDYPCEVVSYFGAYKNRPKDSAAQNGGLGVNYTDDMGVYSCAGDANGAFNKPLGMAFDIYRPEDCRFAVADTENNRVQIFSFDSESGEISFEASYGSKANVSTLYKPNALAFTEAGDLLVADICNGNGRVVCLEFSGTSLSQIDEYTFPNSPDITGICYDNDGADGFWVTFENSTKASVAFYHCSDFNEVPVVSYSFITQNGALNPGEVDHFSDVQVWTVGDRKRICATDWHGSRLQILDPVYDGEGYYTDVALAADIGHYGDNTLEDYQKLWQPNGVFPIDGSNVVYVADYGHNQVKWYTIAMDGDGDGMEDLWEDMNGLDSTRDDSHEDKDGDGLLNIGEFRSGCDPQNEDSDGDGVTDLAEMLNLTDPLDPDNTPDPAPTVEVVSVVADPTEIEIGDSTTITITFSDDVENDVTVSLYDTNGVCAASVTLKGGTNELAYTYIADGIVLGEISVRVTSADTEPGSVLVEDVFVVSEGAAEEEYEEVPWYIDSFSIDNTAEPAYVINWTMPVDSLPAEAPCEFRVEYRLSLSEGEWQELGTVADTATFSKVTSAIGSPSSVFFRLIWTNKVR